MGEALQTAQTHSQRFHDLVAKILLCDTYIKTSVRFDDSLSGIGEMGMSFNSRVARIKDRESSPKPEWNDRTLFEMPQRALFGLDVREPEAARREPKVDAFSARRIVFVDFCPGGVVCNRQDVAWIQQGVCTFETFSSDEQWEVFQSIAIGDLLVMKRSVHFTRTMLLHAWGRVFGCDLTEKRDRVLLVNWSHEQGQIEVPLLDRDDMMLSCEPGAVQEFMPEAFWDWLKK